jgi:hypothetical protein
MRVMRLALTLAAVLTLSAAGARAGEPVLDPAVKAALLASTTIFCTTTLGDELEEVASVRDRMRRSRMTQEGLAADNSHIERVWSEVLVKHQKAIAAVALPTKGARPDDAALAALAAEAVAVGKSSCPTWKASRDVVIEFWNGAFNGRLNRKPAGKLTGGPTAP